MTLSRRDVLRAGVALGAGTLMRPAKAIAEDDSTGPLETFVPCRTITRGPKFHWFGYYDKREFDADDRLVLANEVDFEHRSPTSEDEIRVGYVDTADGDHWHEIGSSRAWGWQQGCMLQWRAEQAAASVAPGDDAANEPSADPKKVPDTFSQEVLWNDRDGERFVCRMLNLRTGRRRTLGRPIYTISPDGKVGLSLDFSRLDNLRPGYGYDGLADPHIDQRTPEETGIWRVDLETGQDELIVSVADAARVPYAGGDISGCWHYFNHLLINPDATRFIFLHRWRQQFDPTTRAFRGGFTTRMFTANLDGSGLYVLDPSGHTSHFIWKSPQQVCAWTRPANNPAGFYLFTDQTREVQRVGAEAMTVNGHNTYLPAPYDEWILNDTYPDRQTRRQTLYLYHPPSERKVVLGHFPSPPAYRGEWRCDLHPRSSNDGHTIAIDSPHKGGRQVHLLDVRDVLGG